MPKTKKQYIKKTHKFNKNNKNNKTKFNKNNKNNKNNKTKKQTISFAQKQKAIKLLKQTIKKHILNIIKAHKTQHQHKLRGGGNGGKQCGGGSKGNIFTRLWESFRKVIQRILESMGFSKQESKENAGNISNAIKEVVERKNNNVTQQQADALAEEVLENNNWFTGTTSHFYFSKPEPNARRRFVPIDNGKNGNH